MAGVDCVISGTPGPGRRQAGGSRGVTLPQRPARTRRGPSGAAKAQYRSQAPGPTGAWVGEKGGFRLKDRSFTATHVATPHGPVSKEFDSFLTCAFMKCICYQQSHF